MAVDPLQVTNELITIFSSADDYEILSKVTNNYQHATKLQKEQEDEVKKAIEGLTQSVELQHLQTNELEDDENSEEIERLGAQKGDTLKQIENLEGDLKRLTDRIGENENTVVEIEKKRIETEKRSEEIQAKVKYNFSLYTNISRIRWDYNCEEDQIKGFVASLNDVKPFCLDSKQNSKYYTVNYLWDLMES